MSTLRPEGRRLGPGRPRLSCRFGWECARSDGSAARRAAWLRIERIERHALSGKTLKVGVGMPRPGPPPWGLASPYPKSSDTMRMMLGFCCCASAREKGQL